MGEIWEVISTIWGEGGPYDLEEIIGTGGEGDVYRARDSRSRTLCALKNIQKMVPRDPPSVTGPWEKQQKEVLGLMAEAAKKSGFIAAPRHFFKSKKPARYVQVVELLSGATLDEAEARLGEADRRLLANMIAAGLASIHEMGLAVVDLKPSNIFVNSVTVGGKKTLIAKLIDPTSGWKCGYGAVPRGLVPPTFVHDWFSPEVYFWKKEAIEKSKTEGDLAPSSLLKGPLPGTESDVFLAGLILYELLTRRTPLPCKVAGDRRTLFRRIFNGKEIVPHPADLAPTMLDRGQGDAILAMLAKNRAHRPTMREVHQVLIGVKEWQPRVAPVPAPAPSPAPGPAPAPVGRLTIRGGNGKTLAVEKSGIDLVPAALGTLGAVPWKVNIGKIAFSEKMGWYIRLSQIPAGAAVRLDGADVPQGVFKPVSPGKHELVIGALKVALEA